VSRPLVLALAALALLGACSQPEAGGAAAAAPPPAATAQNSGKVLQFQDGGGYTYAEVQTPAGQKVWIAGSQIQLQQGSVVEWGNAAVMRDFTSKSLGRSFPQILFVDRWALAGRTPVATAPHGSFPPPPVAAAAATPATEAAGVVKSVVNAGGYSYIELVQADGKTVWVAAVETPLQRGDKVRWQGGTPMNNFMARSLGRTFDTIIFAQGISLAK